MWREIPIARAEKILKQDAADEGMPPCPVCSRL
jgi:hypothetical protein